MDDLRRLAFLAEVVEAGSMSGAARALGTSPSAISQQLRQLEREAGVTLLHRTTRRLALTEAGERVHAEAALLLAAARRAREQLRLAHDAPSGELRLSAPVGFARHVAPALGPLLAAHPALTLRLLVDDARIDLVQARIDLAIRFGPLPDSSWVARRLGEFEMGLYGAPALLKRQGGAESPQALASWPWLMLVRERLPAALLLNGPDGAASRLAIEPRISSNNQLSLQQMCVAGLGLALLARVDVEDDLRGGRLLPVLPQWAPPPLAAWAVTPQRDAQPAKVRHAAAAVQGYLLTLPGVAA